MSFGQHPRAANFEDLSGSLQAGLVGSTLEIALWFKGLLGHQAPVDMGAVLGRLAYKFENIPMVHRIITQAAATPLPVAPLPEPVLLARLRMTLDEFGPWVDSLSYRATRLMWVELAEGLADKTFTPALERALEDLITTIDAWELVAPLPDAQTDGARVYLPDVRDSRTTAQS